MTPERAREMLAVLAAAGVSSFKCPEFEVTFTKAAPMPVTRALEQAAAAVSPPAEGAKLTAAERLAILSNPVVEVS